jgi:hypothetical protein
MLSNEIKLFTSCSFLLFLFCFLIVQFTAKPIDQNAPGLVDSTPDHPATVCELCPDLDIYDRLERNKRQATGVNLRRSLAMKMLRFRQKSTIKEKNVKLQMKWKTEIQVSFKNDQKLECKSDQRWLISESNEEKAL